MFLGESFCAAEDFICLRYKVLLPIFICRILFVVRRGCLNAAYRSAEEIRISDKRIYAFTPDLSMGQSHYEQLPNTV